MNAPPKPVRWMGDSLANVRSFPASVRQHLGFQLELAQHGLEPTDWKPMSIVGPGVREIRSHIEGEHRVLYVAKFRRAVYVLHALEKKSQRTGRRVIGLARARYQEMLKLEGKT